MSISNPWIQDLEGVIARTLDRVDDGSSVEYLPLIENTLARLQALHDLRTMPVAIDATSQFKITQSSYTLDPVTLLHRHTITLRNATSTAVQGPITFVLDGLSDTAMLTNATGVTAFTQPTDSPYVPVPGSDNGVAAGATVMVNLEFASSSSMPSYTPRVLVGRGLDSGN